MTTLQRWPLLGGLLLAAALPSARAALTNLYNFTDGVDGAVPQSGLIQGATGAFYGTAINGGTNGFGTIFSVTALGALTPLYSFNNALDGASPWGGLLQLSNGDFFGTTLSGGAGFGTIFSATADGTVTPLYQFNGNGDGEAPEGALALGQDGELYGTASAGGTNNFGSVFRVATNGSFTSIYSFTGGVDGAIPTTGLTLGANGDLYGLSSSGGASNVGTIFKITPAGQFALVYAFTNGQDGASPQVPLVAASDGNFYGATSAGGVSNNGTLFRLTGDGAVTALYSFSSALGGTNGDGISPAALLQARNGNLYGVTSSGGANGTGTIFTAALDGAVTTLYSFGAVSTGSFTNTDGANPSGLIQGNDGNFYGTTLDGGPDALGTIFAWSVPTSLAFLTPGGIQYSNGQAILRLSGGAGAKAIVVDASPDLAQWIPIFTNPPGPGEIQLTDVAAPAFPGRFYRARFARP